MYESVALLMYLMMSQVSWFHHLSHDWSTF